MLARVSTFAIDGVDARPVWAEVDVRPGLPSFRIVGLADAATREARERVRGALVGADFAFPASRITANLAPAHVRKVGPGFDAALAVGILAATQQCAVERLDEFAVYAELTLSGELRPCRGTLAAAQAARRNGLRGLIVPRACALEAAAIDDLQIVAVDHLATLAGALGGGELPPLPPARRTPTNCTLAGPDVAELRGQQDAVRALEIAAAGGHHLLLVGARGTGVVALARRLPGLLPPLTDEEAIEVTRIHSIAGLHHGAGLVDARPFRAPHHSISAAGLLGGGRPTAPGEATLSHRGVLLLDALPEFSRPALQGLRPALADGELVVAHGSNAVKLPTRFLLVATAPPCPGGCPHKRCQCPTAEQERYCTHLAVIRDQFQMRVNVEAPDVSASPGPTTEAIRQRVVAAREVLRRDPSPHLGVIARGVGTRETLETRRILHVATSIAALDGRDRATREDVADAAQFAVAI